MSQVAILKDRNKLYADFCKGFADIVSEEMQLSPILSIYPKGVDHWNYSGIHIYKLEDFWIVKWDDGDGCDDKRTFYFTDAKEVCKLVNLCVTYWSKTSEAGVSVPLGARSITPEDLDEMLKKPKYFEFERRW